MYDVAIWICLYVVIFFLVIFAAEIVSYSWHRYLAHPSLVNKHLPLEEIVTAHRLHHDGDLTHDASEDFVWIVYGLILVMIIFGGLYLHGFFRGINRGILIAIILGATTGFILNWYFHLALHEDNHWLQKWSLVRDLQTVHFVHHDNPYVNYSILDLSDTIFGTFGTK